MIDITTKLPKFADITTQATPKTAMSGLMGSPSSLSSFVGRSSPLPAIMQSMGQLFKMADAASQDDYEMQAVQNGAVGDDSKRVARNVQREHNHLNKVLSTAAETALMMLML